MKKVFTLSCLVLMIFTLNVKAQTTRLVLAEEFTQASCGPCASQNPTFNTLLDANPTKVVAIKYQTSWPGIDPMNDQTQSIGVGQRVNYYQVSGVPTAEMDGTPQTGSSYTGAPANWTAAKLNARQAVMSPFTLNVSHSLNATLDSIFITVDITAAQAVTGGDLVAQVAIVERKITFCSPPGTNGESVFESVMREMLPDVNGTTLPLSWTLAQTQTITFAVPLPEYIYDKNQIAVVAFIQDNFATPNPEVLQAAYSAPLTPLAVDARLACSSVTGIPDVSCGAPINPVVKIQNTGTQALTSANINYSVDGVPATPVAWTGNLVTNATANVNLPTISSTTGPHTLFISISDPDNMTDYNNVYDSITKVYNVYSTTGNAIPLFEDFPIDASLNYTFPPTNWVSVNPDNAAGWSQSWYGLNDTGSARMDFYESTAGNIDELWTTNYDLSTPGITTAQLDFDEAYCRYYSGSTFYSDEIQIMYSTDCGQTWSAPIYDEAGSVLASGNADTTSAWHPWMPSHYHHKTASLNGAIGSSGVFIKFKGISGYGQLFYMDNINLTTNLSTSVVQLTSKNDISVYPNPSQGTFNVELNLPKSEDVTIVITNALGSVVRTISRNDITSDIIKVDLGNESKGTYNVSVKTKDNVIVKRVTITE